MSSLCGKIEAEVEIKIPPEKFHEMVAGRPHHVPKASAEKMHNCDLHEGEWGEEGSIIYWNYFHNGKKKVAKELVERVDAANNEVTFKVLEGDLMEEYKSFRATIQGKQKQVQGEPGSIVHWILDYEKISNDTVNHPEMLLDFCIEVSKEIGDHLYSED